MRAYTNGEIIGIYKGAKDKVQEISILAELNNCDEATIIEILLDAGGYEGQYKTCIMCGREFVGVYKRGHSNMCPDCRHQINERQRIQTMIKKNQFKIQELAQKNVELIELLEAQKERGTCSTRKNAQTASIKAVR